MKKLIQLLALVLLLAVSCQTDQTVDNTIGEENGTILSISLESTKISLGNKGNNGIYPIYWNEGDRIVANGELSDEVKIDSDNKSVAKFQFTSISLTHPYRITYPYCASTTAEQPIVEFPSVQNYTEGSFEVGSAPMCGYAETGSDAIALSHLAATLRFPVKAVADNIVLDRVVITSTSDAKISGEFAVDCKSAITTATDKASNVLTYNLPDNFVLSNATESVFYISLPAVSVGNCTVEFIEASGKKMVANWAPNKPLARGVVREFSTITYQPRVNILLTEFEREDDELEFYYDKVYGYVRYSDGSPIEGVAVSDGFQVVATDANGYYEISGVTPDTWYIYCSLPADVKVPIDNLGRPCFFQEYPANSPRYNFTFERIAKESEFALLALADIQVSNTPQVERFMAQAVPEIKSYTQKMSVPCYGVALGDIIYSTPYHNDEYLLPAMQASLDANRIGIPVFAVMGNHDNAYYSESSPIYPDKRSSNFNLAIQRPFEECFGPINYSFNRGDAHIISMRNMQYNSNISLWGDDGGYIHEFTDRQLAWFEQDIALVPKDKTIILCVHIPMYNRAAKSVQTILSAMDQFANAYILSGHLHYRKCYDHTKVGNSSHKAYEQSLSSAGWGGAFADGSNLNCDGAPLGYGVVTISNGVMNKSIHKGYVYGMNDENYQIRLHRGKDITGAAVSGTNKNNTKGYYQFGFDENTILANVFSSDPWYWTVEVWRYDENTGERVEKLGNMQALDTAHGVPLYEELIGTGTIDDPKRPADGVISGRDFWTAGVLLGYLGTVDKYRFSECFTMWRYTLSEENADAKVMVVARDRYGNEYTQTDFQVGTDLAYAIYDPANNSKVQ